MKQNKLHYYTTMIMTQFPDISIQSVESLGEGFRNYAILVNGDWVFRFPKSQQGADELNKEIQLLPLLVGCPQYVYIGKRSDGNPFVGYRKVQGQILGEDGMAVFPDDAKDRLALQLAEFMNELSAFPVETAISAGVPVTNLKNKILLLWRIRCSLFLMSL